MNTPSIKTLSRIFADIDKAKQAKAILTTSSTRTICSPAVDNLRKACFNPPSKAMIRLTALNELGELYGIECAETTNGQFAEYLNTGATYAPTVIYFRGRYTVSSLGDFVETLERQNVRFK